jgi:histidyl-tRNA synthetase
MAASSEIPKFALQPVSGTRDFYPDQMAAREWLFKTWDRISETHNFRKYDAPIVEHAELYTRKGGDDILKEMYSFISEKKTLCLRPEMTPTLARMSINSKNDVLPLKWFCQAQCWRFETVTKGRKREHYQWNADILGGDVVKSDAEILSLIASFFEQVNLTPDEVGVKVSHRGLLQGVFESVGVSPDQIEVAFNLVDKIEKLSRDDFVNSLITTLGITESQVQQILAFTDVKSISDLASIAIDSDLWRSSVQNITDIFDLLRAYGIDRWFQFDASIVRGLSYYTGIVFEGFFKLGTLKKALVGGGRYDNLTKSYSSSSKLTAVGFGMGDVVIMDVLGELGKLPDFTRRVPYCIGAYNDELYREALCLTKKLRDRGEKVDLCTKTTLKQIFAYADKIGAEKLVLLAPAEWDQGCVIVKNLRDGSGQLTVSVENL